MKKDNRRQGFVSLHRSILDWEWYDDIYTYRLFSHLLLTAEFKTRRIGGKTVKRGQRLATVRGLSQETHLSEANTRTAINHLKSTHEITWEPSPQGTVITIKNYSKYQEPTQQPTHDQHTKPENQHTTNTLSSNKRIINKRGDPPAATTLPKKKFIPPTVEQVSAYCKEKGYHIDPENFVDFYTANGWRQGKGKPIVDWMAAVRTWERRERASGRITEEDDSDVL